MSTADGESEWTTVTIRRSTHRRVKACKRGGESFDSLLGKMAAEYDPTESGELSRERVEASQR